MTPAMASDLPASSRLLAEPATRRALEDFVRRRVAASDVDDIVQTVLVEALAAAERPEPGDWLYFVTVDIDGTTLFTKDYPQHLANIELARRIGVLDSAR